MNKPMSKPRPCRRKHAPMRADNPARRHQRVSDDKRVQMDIGQDELRRRARLESFNKKYFRGAVTGRISLGETHGR